MFFSIFWVPTALDIHMERSGLRDRAWDLSSFILLFAGHKNVSMFFFHIPDFLRSSFRVHFVPSRVSFPRWLAGSV
jgi:hypothetical protein